MDPKERASVAIDHSYSRVHCDHISGNACEIWPSLNFELLKRNALPKLTTTHFTIHSVNTLKKKKVEQKKYKSSNQPS